MKHWTKKQLKILRKEYPNCGAKQLVEKLGRSQGAITNKAVRLGIECKYYPGRKNTFGENNPNWKGGAVKRKSGKGNRNYYAIKRLYNLSEEEFNILYEEQQGCCKICGRSENDLTQLLCVDHRHSDGKIRGLLCNHCNSSLGWLERYKVSINSYEI